VGFGEKVGEGLFVLRLAQGFVLGIGEDSFGRGCAEALAGVGFDGLRGGEGGDLFAFGHSGLPTIQAYRRRGVC
jgi:hypothetical protein